MNLVDWDKSGNIPLTWKRYPEFPHHLFTPIQKRCEEIEKEIVKLEDEWIYKYQRNLWPKADANYYTGEKNKHGERHGLGVVSLPNGDYYIGQWKRDLRHGIGKTLTGWSVKEINEEYLSEWLFDEPHGIGIYKTEDNLTYCGEWKKGRQDGFGLFSWPNETTSFLGYWKSGERDGIGIYQNSKIVHYGRWVNGNREGEAEIMLKDDLQIFYQFFKEDKMVR